MVGFLASRHPEVEWKHTEVSAPSTSANKPHLRDHLRRDDLSEQRLHHLVGFNLRGPATKTLFNAIGLPTPTQTFKCRKELYVLQVLLLPTASRILLLGGKAAAAEYAIIEKKPNKKLRMVLRSSCNSVLSKTVVTGRGRAPSKTRVPSPQTHLPLFPFRSLG